MNFGHPVSDPAQAFQTTGIADSIVAFSRFLRKNGIQAGVRETLEALEAARSGITADRNNLKWSLRAIFCQSPEDFKLFEGLFVLYWDTNPIDLRDERNKTNVKGIPPKTTQASLVMLGLGKENDGSEDAKPVSGANHAERLKKTDFSRLTEIESNELEEIAARLFREMSHRLRRRLRRHKRPGLPDLRKTLRRSIPAGGTPVRLFFKDKRIRKERLIVLLDVSGSMDRYSLFLLRFMLALRWHFRQMESFIFSTSLVRITRLVRPAGLDAVMQTMAEQAENWSSGTRIGECFRTFMDRYGKRMLNGQPLILILSDGLDTGDPAELGSVLKSMASRSRRVVWLNPLKGMKDYQPLTRGMQAALPSISDFRSAHNLQSLLDLENILAHE